MHDIHALIEKHSIPAVRTFDDMRHATDVLKIIKTRRDELEAERKSKTDPLLKEQKRIKAEYDTVLLPVDAWILDVKKRMAVFMDAEQQKADATQKLLEAQAIADNPGASEIIVPLVNDIRSQRGEDAIATAVKRRVFSITDESLVPREFCSPDETKIRTAVQKGIGSIAGVEITVETSMRIR